MVHVPVHLILIHTVFWKFAITRFTRYADNIRFSHKQRLNNRAAHSQQAFLHSLQQIPSIYSEFCNFHHSFNKLSKQATHQAQSIYCSSTFKSATPFSQHLFLVAFNLGYQENVLLGSSVSIFYLQHLRPKTPASNFLRQHLKVVLQYIG